MSADAVHLLTVAAATAYLSRAWRTGKLFERWRAGVEAAKDDGSLLAYLAMCAMCHSPYVATVLLLVTAADRQVGLFGLPTTVVQALAAAFLVTWYVDRQNG